MIELAWFVIGFVLGVTGSIAYVMYIGQREIKKRHRREVAWQQIKKGLDREFNKELRRQYDDLGI